MQYVTEDTDYFVVVDVDHEDMPLWLLAPRPQLQKRLDNKFYPGRPILPLPIFDGLFSKEGDCGYDCACILSSLHRIGSRPPEPDAPSFQEACELIRRTRAVVDPAALVLPKERERDYTGDQSIPDSLEFLPYSELGSPREETKGGKEELEKVSQE